MEKASSFTKSLFNTDKDPVDIVLEDEEAMKGISEEFAQEVIADMKQRYETRKSERIKMDLQIRLNINFYNGEQFTKMDSFMNDIEESLPLSTWEERNVFNEIAPAIETRFAILSKRKNNLKNRPASASSEDRTSAKIGNKILASTKRRLSMGELQQEANLISGIMATAVWKTVWDSSRGRIVGEIAREITDKENENLTKYEYENKLLGYSDKTITRKIREGDVLTTIHSPLEVFPENIAVPDRKQRRTMHVALISPDELFERWGAIEEGKDNDTYKITASSDKAYGSGVTGFSSGSMFASVTVHDTVKVYEEWELPSARYPDGRLIVCTDNNLLHYGVMPDKMGEDGGYILPFKAQQSLKSDGYFGKSVIERMISVQIQYNAIKNRRQDYINRVAIGVISAEENSLVDEDYFLENGIAPGDMLLHKLGSNPPKFLDNHDLPVDLRQEEESLLSMFDRLSGVSQLAKQSVLPSQVTSGVAIAGLAEQDDTRIGLEGENIKHSLIAVGKMQLMLYHNNVVYPRMVEDIGSNNEFEISQFKGSDLTSFDIFVESEPEASDTLSQRRQKVVELLNGGLFNDPETGNISSEGRIKVFEMLELGDWENFVEADNDQKKRAERENNAMVTGEDARMLEFDDHVIHISSHNNFRLKAEYDEALSENPEIDERITAHVDEHLRALQQLTSTEQQMGGLQPEQLTPSTFGGETGGPNGQSQ